MRKSSSLLTFPRVGGQITLVWEDKRPERDHPLGFEMTRHFFSVHVLGHTQNPDAIVYVSLGTWHVHTDSVVSVVAPHLPRGAFTPSFPDTSTNGVRVRPDL